MPKRVTHTRNYTGLGRLSQPPILEHRFGDWIIWLNYNPTVTAGTYLALHADGAIDRVTMQPTGEPSSYVLIKPPTEPPTGA